MASVTLSKSSFTCADLGISTVTVTVTDASGNISNCNATVTVVDPFPASVNAGSDGTVCISAPTYSITGAIAVNTSILWTTSGSGTFNNPALLNPVYTRGPTDITNVTLTLTGTKISGCPVVLTDNMVLTFAGVPTADAGADKDLCSGTATVSLSDASAMNGTVSWTSSGNGTFSDPSLPNPVYTFGSADTGPVILTITVTSPACGVVTDNVTITFTSAPVADAGPGGALCRTEAGFQVTGASHGGGTVMWTSSGNGTFDNATIDNPFYTFGTTDYSSGTVTLTMEVTGGGLCGTVSSSAVVTIRPLPVIQVTQHDNITCTGLTDGEIHLDATNGQSPYTYSIDGSPFQASGVFTGLAAGSYDFEVTDAYGCVSDTALTVIEPLAFNTTLDSTSNISCNGGADGAIYITPSGGTEPYSISWTGPSGWTASTADITGLAAGAYSLTITDANACASFSFDVTLTEPAALVITGAVLSDFGGYGVSCPAAADGSVTVTASGGTPPLAYLWTGPGGFTSSQANIASVPAGTYTLTITDSQGCVITHDYTLTAPEPMVLTAATVNGSCPDTPDGSIDLTVDGGAGTLIYQWDDGATTPDRTGILPGDYTVTVTDDNGCTGELTVTVGVTGHDCLTVYEIITPNADGRNDTWKLRNAELYPDAEIFVYNRWGRLVFHTRNATDEWDGRSDGKLLPNDSYHYVIHLNDGSEPRTGVISIISK